MKFRIFFALFLAATSSAFCQSKTYFTGYKNFSFDGQDLKVNTETGQIRISAYDQNVLRVTYLDALNEFSDSSYVLVSKPQSGIAKVSETPESIILKTDSLELTLSKNNLQLLFNQAGKTLTRNLNYYCNSENIHGLAFQLDDKESLSGTGSRAIPVNRRGYLLENYHQPHYGYSYGEQNLNVSVPLIISSKGYAIYFENQGAGLFDLGKSKSDELSYSTQSGNVSYFVIAGNNDQILNSYTSLSGKQPLPPRWALGFIQSRFGYKSAAETIETARKTIAAGYPLDAVVLDLFWYGDVKTMGNHDWRRDSFPQPEKMLAELNSMGLKTIPITQTYVTKLSDNFNEVSSKSLLAKDADGKDYIIGNFWAGASGLIDIFKPKSQQYLWNFYRQRINEGVAGWWCDLGEPEKHPDSIRHINGTARSVHSVYPLIWSKTIFDGYKKDFPQQRVFNLARSGGAGMQRYSTFPWSGDVSRSWGGYKAQIPIMLGMSMSGIAYMHSDAGGFALGEKDAELYIRWMQFAAFTPIFRAHADPAVAAPEPVFWDAETQKVIKSYVKLRYRYLPYNYSLSYKNTVSGRPMAMPVNYFDTSNSDLASVNDAYLWGEDLLITPIIEKGKTERKVIFPSGDWVHMTSNQIYKDSAIIKADLEDIPVFAKSGSFIPMGTDIKNTEKYAGDTLMVKYFLNREKSARFVLYDDNGKDPKAIEKAEYELLSFTGNSQNKAQHTLVIASSKPGKLRNIYIEIPNFTKPERLSSNGSRIKYKKPGKMYRTGNTAWFNSATSTLTIHIQNRGIKQEIVLKENN
ncbi:TIM-barrel domain-containing protein [Daejeonella oryzae]|uniref:TIM-barrel domain-containing protein n=1 Tax=Daejeonella oryzae TaxID=1122943 RepID=UPI000420749F|nr:TIM-barrel domain-containing protein [Daejeonella oryzae]